jgi:hypothetical protein
MTLGFIGGVLSGKPLMLLGLIVTLPFLRDAVAWFAASTAEREAFRAEIAALRAAGRSPSADQQIVWRGTPGLVLLAIAWLAGSIMLYARTGLGLAVISALAALSFVIASLVDVARQRLKGPRP